jgi:hypothetical protein
MNTETPTTDTDERPAWRCVRLTHVGVSNVPYDVGAIVYGARPLRQNGHFNLDFIADNSAAKAIDAVAAGGVRVISKTAAEDRPPFAGVTKTGTNSVGGSVYSWDRAEIPTEVEEVQPRFKWRGSRGARVDGRVVEPGMEFDARHIEHHMRHMVEPLNDEARAVLVSEFHPDPAA